MSTRKCYGNWLPDIYPCAKCLKLKRCMDKSLKVAGYGLSVLSGLNRRDERMPIYELIYQTIIEAETEEEAKQTFMSLIDENSIEVQIIEPHHE